MGEGSAELGEPPPLAAPPTTLPGGEVSWPSLSLLACLASFLHLDRRFWNQIFTCGRRDESLAVLSNLAMLKMSKFEVI